MNPIEKIKSFSSSPIVEYFDNDRIRWVLSSLFFLICGAVPFLPIITASSEQALSNGEVEFINEVSESLNFYYSGLLGLNIFSFITTVYCIIGAALLIWGLAKRPPAVGCILMGAVSVLFLLICVAAAAFIFVSVAMADINEVCKLSLWGYAALFVMLANTVNIFLFVPSLMKK